MYLSVNLKKAAKKKSSVGHISIYIANKPSTVRELIIEVVKSGISENHLVSFLAKEEIENKAISGKVGFGDRYGEKQNDIQQAIDNALLSFEDGIYRIFMDEKPLEHLEEAIDIHEQTVFTFVRLTMLAGRMW